MRSSASDHDPRSRICPRVRALMKRYNTKTREREDEGREVTEDGRVRTRQRGKSGVNSRNKRKKINDWERDSTRLTALKTAASIMLRDLRKVPL